MCCYSFFPQRTGDNNLGPDPFSTRCTYFGPGYSPYSYYKRRASAIAAFGKNFDVFSYFAVLAKNQTLHLKGNHYKARATLQFGYAVRRFNTSHYLNPQWLACDFQPQQIGVHTLY